jgi:hypothetical protein
MGNTDSKSKKNLILGLMLLLFAGPFAVSWWMYNFTDFGQEGGSYNHGELVLPPRQIDDHNLSDPSDPRGGTLYGKLSLVYFVESSCDLRCDQALYSMRQIRLAMNNNAHRLQRVLIAVTSGVEVLTAEQQVKYEGQLALMPTKAEAQALITKFNFGMDPIGRDRLYLVDPLGNLMMSYSPDSDPAGIIKDLKRLLKYSRIG